MHKILGQKLLKVYKNQNSRRWVPYRRGQTFYYTTKSPCLSIVKLHKKIAGLLYPAKVVSFPERHPNVSFSGGHGADYSAPTSPKILNGKYTIPISIFFFVRFMHSANKRDSISASSRAQCASMKDSSSATKRYAVSALVL